MLPFLPPEILALIYSFDSTYRHVFSEILRTNVMLRFRMFLDRNRLDRCSSIRNYREKMFDVVDYRYFSKQKNKLYGFFKVEGLETRLTQELI